ncbi:hypothetical protein BROUX41_000771 [Berkeleyomyces rouxiae]|uniref:uncharacterized protein n=1 Tax=Berkeleyomyces rouxiae TaxID=2035830 RepID=UPI003B80D786
MWLSLLATLASASLSQAGCFQGLCSDYSFDLAEVSNADWMAKIPDSIDISALSIPGTHNSLTEHLVSFKLIQSQNTNLKTQLESGIRYIDVSGRLNYDSIQIFHGNGYTNSDLDDVLTVAFDFLDKHTQEAIIMRIHKDTILSGQNEEFERAVSSLLASDSDLGRRAKDRVYSRGREGIFWAPKLGELRAKILILQDFTTDYPGLFGIPWRSDGMVVSNWKAIPGHIALSIKWSIVKHALKNANTDKKPRLHITHSSVSAGATPFKAAAGRKLDRTGMNDYLGRYLAKGKLQRTGIISMDFPGKELVAQIIKRNEQFYKS